MSRQQIIDRIKQLEAKWFLWGKEREELVALKQLLIVKIAIGLGGKIK